MIATLAQLSRREKHALAPPEPIRPSRWAEKYREIVSKDAAEPGPWRFRRAPYLEEPTNAAGDPDVDIVILMTAARVGKSETIRNALGYWVDVEPGPCLLVYPNEPSTKEQIRKELIPLFRGTPRLRRHLTDRAWDLQQGEMTLTACTIYAGWAGSPQALASRTIRRVVMDEVDKFPAFSGRDASPVALAKRRTATFRHRRSIIIASTPTTKAGAISREFEACVDRRYYHVPCPNCGARQRLIWRLKGDDGEPGGVKWPEREGEEPRETAARVQYEQSAYYECAANGCRIEESEKAWMVRRGVWISEGYPEGEHPASRSRAYQISALYSLLGDSWSDMAAQWVTSKGDLALEMEFVTQVLGVPLEDEVGDVAGDALSKKAQAGFRRRVVPDWSSTVLLTVDTQGDHFWYVLRAHSKDLSRQIDRGRVSSFRDIEALMDRLLPHETGEKRTKPRFCLIDSGGNRTEEVYAWCRKDPTRRLPVKGWPGDSRPPKPINVREIDYRPASSGRRSRRHWGCRLHLVDTHYYKDVLARRVRSQRWQLCDVDREYVGHMTAEHKVAVRQRGKLVERWEPRSAGWAHDLKDCEVYQLAGRDIAQVERAVEVREWFSRTKRRGR